MSRIAGLVLAFPLALFVFLADGGLKRSVEGSMQLGESIPLIPGVLNLTHVKNTGGAFSILAEHGGVLLLGSSLAVAFVLWMLLERPPTRLMALGCGLILGGAAGNLLDRLTTGKVTDYVDIQFWPLREWPVFNAADVAIVLGVVALLLATLRSTKADQQKT